MGEMVDGVWQAKGRTARHREGRFQRAETQFRERVSADGSSGFKAEAGRYHLYVAHACPWAHRTMIFRALKGLEAAISVSFVEPLMLDQGWELSEGADPVNGARAMHQVYAKARPGYSGRCSVPVLWDKATGTIVNNESAEIIRMLNAAFGALGAKGPDYYPEGLRQAIDAVNAEVYDNVNNGVYKCGFAASQTAYEEAFGALFATLERLEGLLARQRYLVGERLSEADWRLFTTLVRFDAVYFGHFKCNLRRLVDYPNLWGHTRELFQEPGVAGTVDLPKIKEHYYGSHRQLNPTGIVPLGPELDFALPHDRGRLPAAAA